VNAADHATTLGDLVIGRPEAATLFERLSLDYCCGGRRTLADACGERGLDPATVSALLDAMRDERTSPAAPHHDVAGSSITELCDHLVACHHEPLRDDLGRIGDLLATVVRVHGADHAEAEQMRDVFAAMRDDLQTHMRSEEDALFPACRTLDADPGAMVDEQLLELLEDDHQATGAALGDLRRLGRDYDTGQAWCGTHRALLQALSALERDMHQHVHEENSILFPRVRDRVAAGAGGSA
jgi:regulator of cell morphogenesis and NO signaling